MELKINLFQKYKSCNNDNILKIRIKVIYILFINFYLAYADKKQILPEKYRGSLRNTLANS